MVLYWFYNRNFNIDSNIQSHITFFRARIRAIYSTLVENNTTIIYFFKYQYISLLFYMKIKLEFEFQLFLLLTQSEFKYLSTNDFSLPIYMIFYFLEF